jgi:uncharacterized membrane protein
MDVKQQRALAAAVAGILAAIGSVGLARQVHAEEDTGDKPCYGVNKCKGTGDCGGVGHSCAGQNECAGHGYIELDPDDCLRIQGGSLTQEQGKSDTGT